MTKKALRILLIMLAVVIGFYPSLYFFIDKKFGLLSSKSTDLLTSTVWNIGFYTHIILGGLALLIGWTQFNSSIRNKYIQLHRRIGKLYITAVILSSTAGIYIGFFATGGLIPSAGFVSLGLTWFFTTIMAYVYILYKQIEKHQQMMIYSYAACFAAVTLRIWLPILAIFFGDFILAYSIAAWLCWIPNLLVAHFISGQVKQIPSEVIQPQHNK